MEVKRLFDFISVQLEKHPERKSLSAKEQLSDGQKMWRHYSYKEFQEYSNRVSQLLLNEGIKVGEKVAIISNNRPEWNFADVGSQQIGVVNVPMYPTISESDYEFIFKDADIRFVFVENLEIYNKVARLKEKLGAIVDIVSFEKIDGVSYFKEVLPSTDNVDVKQIGNIKSKVEENDIATIIYTSGTTGHPKGVMLTHLNIVSNLKGVSEVVPLVENEKSLSFLPLCHSFERMVFFAYMMMDIHVYYAESLDTIGDNLKEVQPYCFTTVPRLLEKVYEKILERGNELEGFKKKLFFWSLKLGEQYKLGESQGLFYTIQLAIARKLVFSKWKDALGNRVEFIITGAAAMQPRLIRIFSAAQIKVIEGYGLTETSPVLAANRIPENERCVGTVGIPLNNVQIKLVEDGEILAKGDNIMKGYYNRPDLTAEVIDEDGWFHTGDIGTWVEHLGTKFLKITDRKKELFKTAGGKYIAPQVIENKMKESLYIEQIMVVGGDDRKYIGALVVPSFMQLEEWAKSQNISDISPHALVQNPKVVALLENEVQKLNGNFGQWEQIKRIKLLPEEWTIEGGELTPTLKVKRKIISEQYSKEIDEIYV